MCETKDIPNREQLENFRLKSLVGIDLVPRVVGKQDSGCSRLRVEGNGGDQHLERSGGGRHIIALGLIALA